MNECRECETLLAAYVDGETAAGEAARLDRHVGTCEPCRDRVARERAAREVVQARRATLRPQAPADLRARCASQAAAGITAVYTARRPAMAAMQRWVPLSLAATLLLAVGAVFALGLTDRVQALAFQSTLDHVKCARFFPPEEPVEAVEAARQWQATFGWPVTVPPTSAAAGLALKGLRRCAFTDGRVAHIMYEWRGKPLSLYVVPEAMLETGSRVAERFGHNTIMWARQGRTYVLVTPPARDVGLDQVVAYVKASAF